MDCELDRDQFFSSAGGEEKPISKMLACKVTGLGKSPSMKDRRRSKWPNSETREQWITEDKEKGKKKRYRFRIQRSSTKRDNGK